MATDLKNKASNKYNQARENVGQAFEDGKNAYDDANAQFKNGVKYIFTTDYKKIALENCT